MDAKTVRETIIKLRLVDVLGIAIANTLVTKSIAAGMTGGTEQGKLKLMIEAICSDQKVVGTWGAAQTEKQKQAWLSTL
jgi:hypothetical protein